VDIDDASTVEIVNEFCDLGHTDGDVYAAVTAMICSGGWF